MAQMTGVYTAPDGSITRPVPIAVDDRGHVLISSVSPGEAVTIADGADVALGSTTDAALAAPTTHGTLIGSFRGFWTNWLARIPVLGPALAAASMPVVTSTTNTGTPTQVASSASAVTILAANASRGGATVFNDSTAILYLILSATTPTSSVYTVKMNAGAYYELPAKYTGIIKGIWASANGNAVVTELT